MGLSKDEITTHRVSLKVGELTGVDVIRISLVDRGANRVPFRLQKREMSPSDGEGNRVINFNLPFRKREKPVELAGVAIGSEADLGQAKARLTEVGLSTENLIEDDAGNRIFAQVDDFTAGDCQFVKFDDQCGVFLRNAQGALEKAAHSFNDAVGAQQFIPGLLLSTDALHGVIVEILEKAETKEVAATEIKTAIANFGEFLGALADKIPADVFKLEEILTAPGETTQEADASDAGDGSGKSADAEGTGTGKVEKGEATDKDTQTAGDAAEGKVAKSDPEGSGEDPVLKAVEKLTEQITSMSGRIGELDGKVTEATDSAKEAKELAKKSEKALAAVGGLPVGDTAEVVSGTVEKQEKHIPLIDTARSRPE